MQIIAPMTWSPNIAWKACNPEWNIDYNIDFLKESIDILEA